MLGSEHKVTALFLFPDRMFDYSNDYTYPIWFNNQTFYFGGIEYPLSQIEWLCGLVEKDSVYFPNDEDLPKEIDLLFLENGERISATFGNEIYYRLYEKITGKECASFNEKKFFV